MKAIILAAGQGTRLKKYTEDLPKGMLVFLGKTLIERQIETYRRCGIKDIVVVKGFAGDKINYKDVLYVTNEDYASTNMVASLMCAKLYLEGEVIVSYSDIIFEDKMLLNLIKQRNDVSVVVDDDWKDYWRMRYDRIDFDTESLSINEKGYITSLGKENPPIQDIDARYVGLMKFSDKVLEKMIQIYEDRLNHYPNEPWQTSGKPIRNAYMTDMLQALISWGLPVKAMRYSNGWLEFDTNEDYERANLWVETKKVLSLLSIKE